MVRELSQPTNCEKMKTLILTKYYGPTSHKGSRIKCTSAHGVTWHQFDYSARCPFLAAAIAHAGTHQLGNPADIMNLQAPGDARAFVA